MLNSDIRTIEEIEVEEYWIVRVAEIDHGKWNDNWEATVVQYPYRSSIRVGGREVSDAPRVTDKSKWRAIGDAIATFEENNNE